MLRLLTCLVLTSMAFAQAPEPVAAAAPGIRETEFDDFDLESLQAGEWILEEKVTEEKQKDGTLKRTGQRLRLACVKADKEVVWIESSTWDLEAKKADVVFLCEVERKSRKVRKAWRSEKGGRGKVEALNMDPRPKPESPDGSGSSMVVDEARQIGAQQVRCTGMSLQKIRGTQAGMLPAPKLMFVFSKEVPFRRRLDSADAAARCTLPAKLPAGVLTGNLALVEVSVDNPDGPDQSQKLVDFGKDAKPTVKK